MAAPVISISLNISVESVGSSFLRVILIGSISVEVLVAPEVGAAVVASPARVLELDTHLSSEADSPSCKLIKFFLHCTDPIGISQSFSHISRLNKT
nr:hypothetical protein [Tanacetum cinerariifolium]